METSNFSLSDYQKEELKFVFELFKPENGKLSIQSLHKVLMALENSSNKFQTLKNRENLVVSSEPSSPDIVVNESFFALENVSEISSFPNGETELDFEDFVKLYESMLGQQSPEEMLTQAFGLLDMKKCGFIDSKDLKSVAEVLGEKIQNDEEAERLIKLADSSDKGKLSFEDFQKFFENSIKNDDHSLD